MSYIEPIATNRRNDMLVYSFKAADEAKTFAESAIKMGMKALLMPAAAMVWVWPTTQEN